MQSHKLPSNMPFLKSLHKVIIKNHQVPNYTREILKANRATPGFTETSRHFILVSLGGREFFISYDVESSLARGKWINVRFISINLYDDLAEYERDRATVEAGDNTNSHNPRLN